MDNLLVKVIKTKINIWLSFYIFIHFSYTYINTAPNLKYLLLPNKESPYTCGPKSVIVSA